MSQTMFVGDFSCLTPDGSVPVQPGPVIAYVCAPVPVVRVPGTAKTVVHPSSRGNKKYRPCMSGMLKTQGSLSTLEEAGTVQCVRVGCGYIVKRGIGILAQIDDLP